MMQMNKVHKLLAPVLMLLIGACTQQQQVVAPGIYPEPDTDFISRRLQVRLPHFTVTYA